jgi:hypothetical protein
LTCDSLAVEGDEGLSQYLYVVITGVVALNSFEFGIAFDGPFGGSEWYPCTDAIEQPSLGWPGNHTSIALGWEPPGWSEVIGHDQIVVVGAILVESKVEGPVRFTPGVDDPNLYVVDSGQVYVPAPGALGIADISGGGAGYLPCPTVPTSNANWSGVKSHWAVE